MSEQAPPLRDSYEGILQRARQAASQGDFLNGIDLYRRLDDRLGQLSDRVLGRRPELRQLWAAARVELAELLVLEGRYAEAVEVKESLLASDPERADEWRRDLAILRAAQGYVDRGLAELRALAEEKPGDIWRWIYLGAEARVAGRLAESEAAFERAVADGDPDDVKELAVAHYQRFHLFREAGRVDEALAAWEQAVALNPEAGRTVRDVYTLLTDAGRYSQALEYIARDENALQAGLQRGIIASRTGQGDQARQEWQAVAALDPTAYQYGHDAWTEAALRIGDSDRAIEQLRLLLGRFGTPRLVVLSGMAWAMKGDAALAAALFQRAVEMKRRGRPPKTKLDSADWHLLDALVANEQVKAPLRTYFAVVETLWDDSEATPEAREGQPSRVLRL
jgi:tetratricopeptide (TPR) repeat protein